MTISLDLDAELAYLPHQIRELLEAPRTVGLHSIPTPANALDHQVYTRQPVAREVRWALAEGGVVAAITVAVGGTIVVTHSIDPPFDTHPGDAITITLPPSTGASA